MEARVFAAYPRIYVLHHREYVKYVFLEECRPVLILEIVLAQQYLDAGLYAEAAQ